MTLAMATRERVHRAIEGPMTEAARLLEELRGASDEERVVVLLDGWFRGMAAALEELAVAIDQLAGRLEEDEPERPSVREREASEPPREEPAEVEEADEGALEARARASRRETAAVREEREGRET
jgi:hypothetical protein